MSKNNPSSDAEDYLSHLHWHSRGGHGNSVRYEPKWRYRQVRRLWNMSPLERFLYIAGFFIGVCVLLYYAIVVRSGLAIFISAVVGMMVVIMVFAVRDLNRSDARREEHDEE